MPVTKTSFKIAILAVVLVGVAVAAGRLEAQDPRTLLQQGIQAFNDFDPDRALPLLRRGVNPTTGARDSLWAVGVQYVVQTLFDQGQVAQAGVWARWGMRLAPTMRLDEINLVSEVVDSLEAGRAAAAAQPGDALTTTAYSWPSGDPGGGQGRVDITPMALPVPVDVLVLGGGVVIAGRGLGLAPGSYVIRASAQGFQTVEVTREVLPGVTTVVSFGPRGEPHGTPLWHRCRLRCRRPRGTQRTSAHDVQCRARRRPGGCHARAAACDPERARRGVRCGR